MVHEPAEIEFAVMPDQYSIKYQDIMICGKRVGWIEPRPAYCDRGHWKFGCELPGLDGHDGFPRYYMDFETARAEIIAWLNWRLWRR